MPAGTTVEGSLTTLVELWNKLLTHVLAVILESLVNHVDVGAANNLCNGLISSALPKSGVAAGIGPST